MKMKFMKKMIAVLCASAMMTSCAASSVGAVRNYYQGDGGMAQETDVQELEDMRLSAIDILEGVSKKVKNIKGHEEKTGVLLAKINSVLDLLRETDTLKLDGAAMVQSVRMYTDEIVSKAEEMSKEFLRGSDQSDFKKLSDAELLDVLDGDYFYSGDSEGRSPSLLDEILRYKEWLQFSNELCCKHWELNRAGKLIKKIKSSQERDRLQNLYDQADGFYRSIRSEICPDREGKKQKDKFFNLANRAVDEIGRIGKEEERKENERKEKERREIERRIKEIREKEIREKERKEKERREIENLVKRAKLIEERRRLDEERNELDKKLEELGNVKGIYDGLYTRAELPLMERLFELNFRWREVNLSLLRLGDDMLSGRRDEKLEREKELIRKKFEINRKYVNLLDELDNIIFLRNEGNINLSSELIEHDIKAAKKAIDEINLKIKEEMERE